MIYKITPTISFKKDLKKFKTNKKLLLVFFEFLELLQTNGVNGLDDRHKAHRLKGKYKDKLEAHIKPDFLIIWEEIEEP
ncbi:MAG: type II toxin-antitoxin system mRNA interferase toxin, RelE/StbE family, partial [Planktothrix sp.]